MKSENKKQVRKDVENLGNAVIEACKEMEKLKIDFTKATRPNTPKTILNLKKINDTIASTFIFDNPVRTGDDQDYMTDADRKFYQWLGKLDNHDLENSVLVCYEDLSYEDFSNNELTERDRQHSILISHRWEEITNFSDEYLNTNAEYDIYFNAIEFKDYESAFEYCKDLRKGF